MERTINWMFIFIFAVLTYAFIKSIEIDADEVLNCKVINAAAVRIVNGGFVCVKRVQ